jgi:hypothetical protein
MLDKGFNKEYKIGIYTGNGASHSWLWFVDIFEKFGILNMEFIDSESILKDNLVRFNVMIFSGGDTFSIAESIGPQGAEKLKNFISSGGLYLGSCAGAYFPLYFDFPPLNYFNLINAGVANFAVQPPEPFMLPEKFSCPYGNGYVFHPLREEVNISFNGRIFTAPLYGGPAFVLNDDAQPLGRYHSFTKRTVFLCDKKYANQIYLNNPAIIMKKLDNGFLILSGPHLEHPSYESANFILLELIEKYAKKVPPYENTDSGGIETSVLDLKKIVSNSRIMAEGLIAKQLKWKMGRKIYEAEKIAYFIDFVWKRLKAHNSFLFPSYDNYTELLEDFTMTWRLLKELSLHNTIENFGKLLCFLKNSVTKFISVYHYNKKLQGEKLYA